ncbi:hypothetical protein HO133_008951 [Letharia lupina]|uniref:Phenol hydroxylase-like C-terminal dimerisation domain-containing protein n=1 Tax=Letharia lupina TaxID=560253 RepID=A0A8H6FFD3_9LECA|nr:uncharacterized protein HO133_008951 [Letharia lupina]KAF6226086.1 hypothetical protein HO133_008951 [Letharia lupina]
MALWLHPEIDAWSTPDVDAEPPSITHKPSGAENQSAYPVTVRTVQVGTETSSYPVAKPTSNGAIEIDGPEPKEEAQCYPRGASNEGGHGGQICDQLRWRTKLDKIAGCGLRTQGSETDIKSQQHLAPNTPLGQHFLSFVVINHCDARSWHFGELLKAGGLFAVVLFAGGVSRTDQIQRVHKFAGALANVVIPLVQHHISGGGQKAIYDVADILTIRSAPGGQVEYSRNCYVPSMRSLVVTYCVYRRSKVSFIFL